MAQLDLNTQLPIYCVAPDCTGLKFKGLKFADLKLLSDVQKRWVKANGFVGKRGQLLALPDREGAIGGYVFGVGEAGDRQPLDFAKASTRLPNGRYCLEGEVDNADLAALGFNLGTYRFTQYKPADPMPELVEKFQGSAEISAFVEGAFLARDLINRPANDLGPDAFEETIREFAKSHKMSCKSIVGDKLLKENFPMIHAVGRASDQAPRLLDLHWGNKDAPKVTLVGKGVTFDTGGLDIKPAAGMVLMKKDMGGAANVLGLAHIIMAGNLKVRLRVLLPVVENAISANAFRPGDVLPSRSGLSVEIGNTDAEGRLILADAIAYACEEKPEMLIDMATLTGAARVALGPDLPPVFSSDDTLAQQLVTLGNQWGDPLWHMPLYKPYDENLSSTIADVNHISSRGGMAGSVTAALFLQRFVKHVGAWVHMDIYGWMPKAQAGRSQGGTDQGMRAAYMVLKNRFGQY